MPTCWCHYWGDCIEFQQLTLIAVTLWTPPHPHQTAYAFNYSLTIETVSALLAWETMRICECLCVRAWVQMTLQPAVLTQRQAVRFNAAGSQNTLGGAATQTVLKRGIICMRLCPKSCLTYTQGRGKRYVFVNPCIFAPCVHFVLASAFIFWLLARRRATVEWISSYKTNCLELPESTGSLESAKQWSLQQFIGTLKLDGSYTAVHTQPNILSLHYHIVA